MRRRDGTLTTTLDVVVSPEDDGDVRRVSVSNLGARTREIEMTSYSEIVLAPASDDAAHPAFSKLFVQTEFVPELGALLATRRRRAPDEPEVWAAHLAVLEGEAADETAIRDRPGALPWTRQRRRLADFHRAAAGRFQTRSGRYSIRSSAFADASASRPARRFGSPFGPFSPVRAMRLSAWPISTTMLRRSNVQPPWPGPRLRFNSIISE